MVKGIPLSSPSILVKESGFGEMTTVFRPEITKNVDGVEMQAAAAVMDGKCSSIFVDPQDCLDYVNDILKSTFAGLDNHTWEYKEEAEYNGKKCTVYYDYSIDYIAIYVHEGYIHVVRGGSIDVIIENKWEAPMESFVLKNCWKENKKFSQTPSKSYIFCDASNLKVAFIAVIVALLSAIF